ncbi:hypothetical protein [Hydrogenophaga intermedia]|uniref:hypothetical protein n=1 Tax=Hydrogenophaga intermedia TaxID=65786 RepID=UPI002043220B|nr:hypothetical protein [Hydrogenophaga intermedia]MCM3565717.1 hypothetical protein [Hydrogenophaga intermedia]
MSIGLFLGGIFSSLWQEFATPQEPTAGTSLPEGVCSLLQPAGPLVNVDGTPMLDCAVDVLGKPYGHVSPFPVDSVSMFGTGLHGSDG